MTDCAFSDDHRFPLKLKSQLTVSPAAFARAAPSAIAAAAVSDIAGVMPVQWNQSLPPRALGFEEAFLVGFASYVGNFLLVCMYPLGTLWGATNWVITNSIARELNTTMLLIAQAVEGSRGSAGSEPSLLL